MDIEMEKEIILEEKYELRWFLRACWCLPLSLALCGIAAAVAWLFPEISTIAYWIAGLSGLAAIGCIGGFFVGFTE